MEVDIHMKTLTVIEELHLIEKYSFSILKFNKRIIKYIDMFTPTHIIHLSYCLDYDKYQKIYKLLYGV